MSDAKNTTPDWKARARKHILANPESITGLLSDLLNAVSGYAEDTSYGYPCVEDPRDFHPDHECSTAAERENHRLACEAWDRGDNPEREPTHSPLVDGDGCEIGHVTRAPWGVGTSTLRDESLCALRDRIAAVWEVTP